jgi:cyclopropane-fatty-acyl-phospholipid synthase
MNESVAALLMALPVSLSLAERDLVPVTLVRAGIRHLLRARLRAEAHAARRDAVLAELGDGPIVPHSPPSEQHVEVPAAFFEQVYGSHVKSSSGYWSDDIATLDDAEAAMLALTCERAGIADGQRVLELGCGWGALSIWMARRYPESRIVAVTDSVTQRAFIESRRPGNLEVITSDMSEFSTGRRFDRIVSVETFERMRNWKLLLRHIGGWLDANGTFFLHLFCHSSRVYPLEMEGARGWLERHFLRRAIMPSADLIDHFANDLAVEDRWTVSGEHYARTAEAWRVNLEARRELVLPILAECYGAASAKRWYYRWRLFFLVYAELFSYRGGTEWHVAHYRLTKRAQED